MAGSTITYPLNGATNWEDFTDIVQKIQAGFMRVSLTNFDNEDLPAVAAGSLLDVNGTVVVFSAEEAITGWGAISDEVDVWIKVVVSGSSATVEFTDTAPTYSAAKRGYYNGNDRYIGGLYKGGSVSYLEKWLYRQDAEIKGETAKLSGISTLDGHPHIKAVHGPPVTLSQAVSRGDPILALQQHYGNGADYAYKEQVDFFQLQATSDGGIVPNGYLGQNLWAIAYPQTGSFTWTVDIYQVGWLSSTATKLGSGYTRASPGHNVWPLGVYYLRDVDASTIEFCVIDGHFTTANAEIWTFRFNTGTNVVSQVGSSHDIGQAANESYSWFSDIPDIPGRIMMMVVAASVTPWIGNSMVWDSNGDGTYTQRGVTTQIYNTATYGILPYYWGQPIKISSNEYYVAALQCNSNANDAKGWAYIYNSTTHAITVVSNADLMFERWDELHLGNDSDRIWTVSTWAGRHWWKDITLAIAANYVNTTNPSEEAYWFSRFSSEDDKWYAMQRAVTLTPRGGIWQSGRPTNFFVKGHNQTMVTFACPRLYDPPNNDYGVLYAAWAIDPKTLRMRQIYLTWDNIGEVQHSTGPANNYGMMQRSYDGQYCRSLPNGQVGGNNWPKAGFLQAPKLLGIADRDYSSGEVCRPVTKGLITGLSIYERGQSYGLDVRNGIVMPRGHINIGQMLTESVMQVDIPQDDYPWVCIDDR